MLAVYPVQNQIPDASDYITDKMILSYFLLSLGSQLVTKPERSWRSRDTGKKRLAAAPRNLP
jgi:hypothetical protein